MAAPIPLHPTMTQEQLISTLNENFAQVENESRTKIIRDETGVNRIIIGKFPDGTYGLAISKVGVDVLTALGA
jgi:hypothetical protein